MDLITHGIMGAVLAQCGFQKRLGRKAILFGALAAMLPDLDVIIEVFAGPIAGFKYHRWISHSLWFGPLIGSLLGYLTWYFRGQHQPLKYWIFLFVLAITTHPLLDLFTSYGTQLFAPFSDHRCSLDVISIIDLRFTGPLLIALIIGLIAKTHEKVVQVISLIALGISCWYLNYAVNIHHQSVSQVLQEWRTSFDSLRSYPTLFQPYLRHLVIRNKDQICVGAHQVPAFDKAISWQCAPQLPNQCSITLINTPIGKRFAWFTDGNYRAEILAGGLIRFHDLRYPVFDHPLQGMWGVEGLCLPNSQLRHFRYKIEFSWQTLKNLGSYWNAEVRNTQ